MTLLATLALGAAIVSAHAPAQPDPQNITRQIAVERADRLFELLDSDHDRLLTRSEAQASGAKLMAVRIATGRDVAPGIGGHTLKYFERVFAAAPVVSKRQFEQAMLRHFDEMDLNHDGILTAAERQAGRAMAEGR